MDIIPKENGTLRVEAIKAELFKRPVPSKYKSVIQEVEFRNFPSPFSHYLIDAFTQDGIDKNALQKEKTLGSEASKLFQAQRTQFGNNLLQTISGRDFVDLGCGSYPAARIIAEACNAQRYVGVDVAQSDEILSSAGKNMGFNSVIIRDDILAFLSKLGEQGRLVFHLSGIEPFELYAIPDDKYKDKAYVESQINPNNRKYILHCMEELQRATKPGDSILIGPVVFGFHPENFGFTLQSADAFDRYHLFVKS